MPDDDPLLTEFVDRHSEATEPEDTDAWHRVVRFERLDEPVNGARYRITLEYP